MINGLQYSVLLDLPYLDPVSYCVVGPMHNLFLGTGKHMMEVWLKLPDNVMRKNRDYYNMVTTIGPFKEHIIPVLEIESMGKQ